MDSLEEDTSGDHQSDPAKPFAPNLDDPDAVRSPPHATTVKDCFERMLYFLGTRDDVGSALRSAASTDEQLQLYGFYKQATTKGSVSQETPGMWNIKAYQKHQAWWKVRDSTKEDAMFEYVRLIQSIAEREGLKNESSSEQYRELLEMVGPVHDSNIRQEGTTSTEDQTQECAIENGVGNETNVATAFNNRESGVEPRTTKRVSTGICSSILYSAMTRVGRVQPLLPRGRLDISYTDLAFAARHCLAPILLFRPPVHEQRVYRQREESIAQQWKAAAALASANDDGPEKTSKPSLAVRNNCNINVMVGLSLRSLFDLYLRVKQYPIGSEVIISPPINVPGMVQVLKHHRLKLVCIDIPDQQSSDDGTKSSNVVSVDVPAIEKAVTAETVAILVVHVFGMLSTTEEDMEALSALTKRSAGRTIDLLEDCAEAFTGMGAPHCYLGSAYADLSFFSFGMIKTVTALNGGVVVIRTRMPPSAQTGECLYDAMSHLQHLNSASSQQSNFDFLCKVCRSLILKVIGDSPLLYGLTFYIIHNVFGLDFDSVVTSLLRGFGSGAVMMHQIRRKPSSAVLALLNRRLRQSDPIALSVVDRVKGSKLLTRAFFGEKCDTVKLPSGRKGTESCYWLYPILVDNPQTASRHLRQSGLDATTGASQLYCVDEKGSSCRRALDLMRSVLYIPIATGSEEALNIKFGAVRIVKSVVSCLHTDMAEMLPVSKKKPISNLARRLLRIAVLVEVLARPVPLKTLVTSMVVMFNFVGLVLGFILLSLYGLRVSMGTFYLSSSSCFAKYGLGQRTARREPSSTSANAPAGCPLLHNLNLRISSDSTENRSVFLTGGTGFVGSMLLHDLLLYRKELHIDCIYMLVREKKGVKPKRRVNDLLNESIYSFLSDTEKSKCVKVISGDVTQPNAGLTRESLDSILHSKSIISHVFHCAAAVSFTQELPDAALNNITSSLNVQALATQFNNSQFVYISTAFVHGGFSGKESDPITESLYSFGLFEPLRIYESMKSTQYYASKAMSDCRFPNTYTFSKSVCENLLVKANPSTLIIRPSIVGPAVESPFEGWAGKAPSTLVAAACLYFHYPWNIWSFGSQRVPCIPVDVLSRFILSKSFSFDSSYPTTELSSSVSEETLSEESFEKVSNRPATNLETASHTNILHVKKHLIFNAAWNFASPPESSFTWNAYAGALTQAGSVLDYFGRPTAFLGLFIACRVLPNLLRTSTQFETLHKWLVRCPFQIILGTNRLLGNDTRSLNRLNNFLDLPLLFHSFTNKEFHFQSGLIAPDMFHGDQYLQICIQSARFFVEKAHKAMLPSGHACADQTGVQSFSSLSCLSIGGSKHKQILLDFVWALTQPRGTMCIRVAGWLLCVLFRFCFDRITVDVSSFQSIARRTSCGNGSCVVLAPTHRSLLDFLILSYMCFALPEMQIDLPIIVAADDFQKLPFFGWLAQCLGATYIRRGRSDAHFVNTVATANQQSSAGGCPIELYIEGKRSRDRRFLKPKTGFLRALHETGGKYEVVPITISYEGIADQASLTKEACGDGRVGLGIGNLFQWLAKVNKGHVNLGHVHVVAGNTVSITSKQEQLWDNVSRTIQVSQAEGIVISTFHIQSTAKLLGINSAAVERAFSKLGASFFPSYECDSSAFTINVPSDRSELLAIVLQLSPRLAPLFQTSRPAWAKWLFWANEWRTSDCIASDVDVKLLSESLEELFDSADACVQVAYGQISQQKFSGSTQSHILQLCKMQNKNIPHALLAASISIQHPANKSRNRYTHHAIQENRTRRLTDSEENLGFWGFHDTHFVVKADDRGEPYVTMVGNRYSSHGVKMTQLLKFIETETSVKINLTNEAFSRSREMQCAPTRFDISDIRVLKDSVASVSTNTDDRIRHGTGHAQQDIFAIRSCAPIRVPDAVAWPISESEVGKLVDTAMTHGWCIIPFGGGTNVSQATRCPSIDVEPRPIISADMRKMKRVLWVDEENGVAHVEAGITGRRLEEELGYLGYTMGHEPDSIEFSTLGGWIATKASGMKRSKYGNIEDIVKSVRVVGPNGLLQHGMNDKHVWGREASGLDICALLVGSEGCLGIVTSAVVRVCPLPEVRDHDGIVFSDFSQGLSFVRQLSRTGSTLPACVRLLDNEHMRLGSALRPQSGSFFHSLLKSVLHSVLTWKVGFDERKCVCVTILYDGWRQEVREQKRNVRKVAHKFGGICLGAEIGRAGYRTTFLIAYLRDFALTYHVLGESFETFAPWSKVQSIIAHTKAAIKQAHKDRLLPGHAFVGCRVTQLYHEGACIYFYFCMNFENVLNPSAVYAEIEHEARVAILANGGSVSHHHGVGKVRTSFLKELDSTPLLSAFKNVKDGMDPQNLFCARNGHFT